MYKSKNSLFKLYKSMCLVRLVEEELVRLYPQQEMKCPHHYSIGQESVAAGICLNLDKKDQIYSSHRCHGHYLAKGGSLNQFMSEMYNKSSGCTHGKGGSMHLIDTSVGMMGSHGVVGTNIPIAMGSAFALKYKNKKNISVVFFGDGGADQGVLYESLNFSALKSLPILFVCENNGYASFSSVQSRHANKNIANRVKNFGIETIRLDSRNPIDFFISSGKIIKYVKKNQKPFFIEVDVDRFMAHCGTGDDVGPNLRTKNDIKIMRLNDPIIFLEKYFVKNNICNKKNIEIIKNIVQQKIEKAVMFAQKEKLPQKKDLMKHIFA